MATLAEAIPTRRPAGGIATALRWASILLVAASWLSAALFGA